MKRLRNVATLLLGLLLLPAQGAFAAGERTTEKGVARQPTQVHSSQIAIGVDKVLHGTVTELDAKGDRVAIQGRWYRIDSGQTKYLKAGQVVQSVSLNKGQALRFTLSARPGDPPTLGVVYVP
jgi:hypothetical protein